MTGGNLTLAAAVILGGGVGAGVWLIVAGTVPSRPALRATLHRLGASTELPTARQARLATGPLSCLLGIPRTELALLGRSVERYVTTKVAYVLLGVALPAVLSFLLFAAGLAMPLYLPAGVSLLLGALFYVVVDVDLRQKATRARRDFRYAVCAYLDLVALERTVGRGPVESLERAAAIGDGWVFDRLRGALTRSSWEQRAPWDALRDVGDEIGVPVLGDLGAIMQLSGEEGAQVYATLRSLAEGLRGAILAEEQNRANTATTILAIPSTALLAVLFGLATYPLIARLLFG